MDTYKNKLLVIANFKEKRYQKGIKEGIKTLNDNGFKCFLFAQDYKTLYKKENKEIVYPNDADYVCSIGGDGAFLYAGQIAIKYNKPLFGINYGHVGHLCAFDKLEINKLTPKLLNEKKISNEPLLQCTYKRKKYYAINDVIIGKVNFGETITLKSIVNNKELNNFRGDGIIVSSRIGSSAYNKSCGGPVLSRKDKFIITPICPSNIPFEYKVVSDKSIIKITIDNKHNQGDVYCDGKLLGTLDNSVVVSKANKKLKAIF